MIVMTAEKRITHNLDETRAFARDISANAVIGAPALMHATVIGLIGDLGAGKTAFVQSAAQSFGITESIISPTYIIEKIYKVPQGSAFKHFVHIDAYRLESPRELEVLGWNDLVSDKTNIIFVEWADKVAELLPKDAIKIHFTFISENERELSF